MTYFLILCAILALTQVHSKHFKTMQERKSEYLIENKNVNIVVNLDTKEVAEELWKVIEARLTNRSNHTIGSQSAIKALENVVTPLVSPTRRGIQPSIYQVASKFDDIARRTLTRDTPSMDMLDEEILTRDIVADMMACLKTILSKTVTQTLDEENTFTRRTLQHRRQSNFVAINNDKQDDDYISIVVKIHKKDILKALS